MSVIYYPGYSQVQVHQNFEHKTILAATQAYNLVITTADNHNYKVGMNVRFLVPIMFGMQELNGLDGDVLAVSNTTLTIRIDSTNFSPFSIPISLPSAYTPASVFANAEGYQTPQLYPEPEQRSLAGTVYNNGIME